MDREKNVNPKISINLSLKKEVGRMCITVLTEKIVSMAMNLGVPHFHSLVKNKSYFSTQYEKFLSHARECKYIL